ncbi:MAG TPA: vWA domain-containing protein [Planctomycetota bacterium]|nr:vWA domain-containing protein [Planctomycetota bacterium]
MNAYMKFAAGPQAGTGPAQEEGRGYTACLVVEVLYMLLDVSGSMESPDWPPTRLGAAQESATALLNVKRASHPQDHVAVVSYSDSAKVVHRPAEVGAEYRSLAAAISRLESEGGTNIESGLEMVERSIKSGGAIGSTFRGLGWLARLNLFEEEARPTPIGAGAAVTHRLVVLSDGQDVLDAPPPVAGRLKARAVTIDTIGIGGSPEDVNEDLLKAIASVGPDGQPRYCFIGQKNGKQRLVAKFEQLGRHLRLP